MSIETTERHYLKDVLPRLYRETEQTLRKWERDDLLEQLPHLFINGRCSCGSCSDFSVDSDLPELSREAGNKKLLRPLFYDTDHVFMLGISGKDGLTEGEHEQSYLSAFELCGGDYRDNYIHLRLQQFGFKSPKKLPKRKRPGSVKRRIKLKRRMKKNLRFPPMNPMTPSGKFMRKRKAMRRKLWP